MGRHIKACCCCKDDPVKCMACSVSFQPDTLSE